MTGWGQTGPLADRAGHDLTYLAISGALSLIGPPDARPAIPLHLVADHGGGGILLVGVCSPRCWNVSGPAVGRSSTPP
jgi:alpha-methylacyl-CoA racemase